MRAVARFDQALRADFHKLVSARRNAALKPPDKRADWAYTATLSHDRPRLPAVLAAAARQLAARSGGSQTSKRIK